MSKTVIGLAALGIGATTAVAAPLAMKFDGGSGEGESEIREPVENEQETHTNTISKTSFKKPNWRGALPTLTNSKDIKNNYQNTDCIKDNFGSVDWSKAGSNTYSLSEAFNFIPNKTKGCLIVDYYEQKYENKWWGEFKLSWSLIDDTQHGFVIVVQAKTQDSKLVVDSAIYVMGSKTDSGLEVKYSKGETKEITEDSKLTDLIPQPGNLIKENEYKGEQNWGFNPKPSNACGDKDCVGTSSETKKTSAVWEISYESGGETIEKLFNNTNELFKNNLNLENVAQQIENSQFTSKLTYTKKEITES